LAEGGEGDLAKALGPVTCKNRGVEDDAAQLLIEELLRTAFSLGSIYAPLLADLPEDAFPGEDPGAVLIEMLAGSSLGAAHAVDEADWESTTALVKAVRERVLSDLRVAAELAKLGGKEVLL
jgi:hypothetical protein